MVVESSTERGLVSVDPLRFALSPGQTLAATLLTRHAGLDGLAAGARVEVCAELHGIASRLATLVSGPGGGAGLVIDYGDDHHFGNSFRGFRDHRIVDPLSRPGETDLTANVDFARLRTAFGDQVVVDPLVSQQHFLSGLGIGARVQRLLSTATKTDADVFLSSALRLVDPTGMGSQYKVLGFQSLPSQQL